MSARFARSNSAKSRSSSLALVSSLFAIAFFPIVGCSHHSNVARNNAPDLTNSAPDPVPPPQISRGAASRGTTTDPNLQRSQPQTSTNASYQEVGMASWYGPPYNRRRGANGEIFDQNAMTAAHRTLPMNSMIRVTNIATGETAVLRVTDRGPFVPGRVLDLSVGAAKALSIYRPGTAKVRVELISSPTPLSESGRWCVQIGAFQDGALAVKLRDRLIQQYASANVIEFTGPTGHWVRIRPLKDNKQQAAQIAQSLRPAQGNAYLTRLD